MLEKFKWLFKKNEQNNSEDYYLLVPENKINEELKSEITDLERFGEECSRALQEEYTNLFEIKGKSNLRIFIWRDIDGDEIEDDTPERCLEKEYRSQIMFEYDGVDEDISFGNAILLWYYFGGYFKGSGTIFNGTRSDLETTIEQALKSLLDE